MAGPPVKTGLYAKLAEVTAELGYVTKDGKNDFQNYRYTSAEALLAAVRGPLSARGVVLMPSLTALSEREYTTSKGKASIITTAHVRFTLVDGETGEKHECEWAGQGDDPADKGLGKAYTNAIKTFLREQFLIPQGDDPEADRSTDERSADRAPSRERSTNDAYITVEQAQGIKAAMGGLNNQQITLVFSSLGLDATKPLNTVPRDKAVSLAAALKAVERKS